MKKILVISLLFLASCQKGPIEYFNDWTGISDDNFVEETAEYIIEEKTGADIDLTPRSKE